jgi:hypothetical protein
MAVDLPSCRWNFRTAQWFRDWRAGRECFVYPASDALMASAPRDFDLVHAHNLHGDYFNLAALARASRAMPVVITLHDDWLMTGHCAYTPHHTDRDRSE